LAAGILGVVNGYLGDRSLSLRQGTIADATLIHAPSSTKNQDGKRGPEMHQSKRGNQYYFGMKAHKAQIHTKVEPPFRVIKRQFGYTKVRFRGLVKTPHNW
jgi:IS5 family transposase